MSKRFTESRKWHDKWFRKLAPKYKLLWIYVLDICNHAGIFETDFELAEFMTGHEYNQEEAFKVFKEKIIVTKNNNWFIPRFILFQYKCTYEDLNKENRCHLSVINILNKEGVIKGLIRGLQGCKDKDKDKDKDKSRPKNSEEVTLYAKSIDFKLDGQYFIDKMDTIGWITGTNKSPVKDWKACIRTWKKFSKTDSSNNKPKPPQEVKPI